MKILHVSSHLPYPPDDGASADIWARLQAMHRLGYTIDSVVIAQKAESETCRSGTPHSRRVLSVGNFYSPLNREGLRWYLTRIHPLLQQDPDYHLVVAGSTQGRSAAHSFAAELKHERCCTVFVDLEDTTLLYKDCAVFINPMQGGAVVKLKSIHAIERCIPVVSTSVGNEGSGFINGQHLRVADRPAEFAAAIRELLNNHRAGEQMACRAHEHLTRYYNCESNIRRLVDTLAPQHSHSSTAQQIALTA